MEPIYVKNFTVDDSWVDRYGRMKPSMLLYLAQEMGGQHSALMSLDYDTLASRRLFWAVSRHGVQIDRMPTRGETIRVETWPLPTTMMPLLPGRIIRRVSRSISTHSVMTRKHSLPFSS